MALLDLSHDGFNLSCGIPMLRDPAFEHSTIDQLNIATGCKGFGLFGEPPGGDNETAGSAFGSHGSQELADNRDAHLERAPVFALHQVLLPILAQNQIDAVVGAVAACFGNAVALPAEGFADQLFELLPIEAVDGFTGLGRGLDVGQEFLAAGAGSNGADGGQYTSEGNQKLADKGECAQQLTCDDAAQVGGAHDSGSVNGAVGYRVKDQPGDHRDGQTNPPRQPS